MKLLFTTLATIPYLVGFFPYLKDIHDLRVKPHIVSWFGWGLTTLLAFFAMSSDIFNWAAYIVLINSIACFSVVVYSLFKKAAVIDFSRLDIAFFLFGIVGIILWQSLDNPDLAILFAIFADLSFGIPTFFKVYKDPKSETHLPWSMSVFSGFLSLFAISYISFTEIAYPVYLFLFDLIIFLVILGYIKKSKKVT